MSINEYCPKLKLSFHNINNFMGVQLKSYLEEKVAARV
jgi:hypothetical protein